MLGLRGRTGHAIPLITAAVGLLLVAFAEWEAAHGQIWSTTLVIVDSTGAGTTIVAGTVLWLMRPDSRLGPLIAVIGIAWFPGALSYSQNQDYVDLVGFPLAGWSDVALVALVLLFPSGRLGSRLAALVLSGTVFSHLILSLGRLLLRVPVDPSSCFCVPNRILPVTNPAIYNTVDRVASVAEASFALISLVIVVGRWRRSSGPARRTFGLVAIAGSVAAALIFYNRLHTRLFSDFLQSTPTLQVIMDLVRIAVPLAATAVLLRGRWSRARVADLVVGLSSNGPRVPSDRLSLALSDPSVQLLRWAPAEQTYVNEDGQPVISPQGATVLEANGIRLGALIHDPALREVAEAERTRLERDLHDGAQQHLLALNLHARRAQRRAQALGDEQLSRQLLELSGEVETALDELRALARGIRPPVLTESGLGMALESLAERCPVPVTATIDLDTRLDGVIEATAYFAASEALTNVLKHAQAGHIWLTASRRADVLEVSVEDDGAGGAATGRGTGLGGLEDRLAALGGNLMLDSAPGRGTKLLVRIPLAQRSPSSDQPADVARR
jgi:signal transduction histidine kinase